MNHNQLVISARIAEASARRYTPAGLPAIDLRLEHESQASEAGVQREVKAALKAVAFGTTAETLAAQAIGSSWRFTGFLNTPRNGKHAVFHVQEFQPE